MSNYTLVSWYSEIMAAGNRKKIESLKTKLNVTLESVHCRRAEVLSEGLATLGYGCATNLRSNIRDEYGAAYKIDPEKDSCPNYQRVKARVNADLYWSYMESWRSKSGSGEMVNYVAFLGLTWAATDSRKQTRNRRDRGSSEEVFQALRAGFNQLNHEGYRSLFTELVKASKSMEVTTMSSTSDDQLWSIIWRDIYDRLNVQTGDEAPYFHTDEDKRILASDSISGPHLESAEVFKKFGTDHEIRILKLSDELPRINKNTRYVGNPRKYKVRREKYLSTWIPTLEVTATFQVSRIKYPDLLIEKWLHDKYPRSKAMGCWPAYIRGRDRAAQKEDRSDRRRGSDKNTQRRSKSRSRRSKSRSTRSKSRSRESQSKKRRSTSPDDHRKGKFGRHHRESRYYKESGSTSEESESPQREGSSSERETEKKKDRHPKTRKDSPRRSSSPEKRKVKSEVVRPKTSAAAKKAAEQDELDKKRRKGGRGDVSSTTGQYDGESPRPHMSAPGPVLRPPPGLTKSDAPLDRDGPDDHIPRYPGLVWRRHVPPPPHWRRYTTEGLQEYLDRYVKDSLYDKTEPPYWHEELKACQWYWENEGVKVHKALARDPSLDIEAVRPVLSKHLAIDVIRGLQALSAVETMMGCHEPGKFLYLKFPIPAQLCMESFGDVDLAEVKDFRMRGATRLHRLAVALQYWSLRTKECKGQTVPPGWVCHGARAVQSLVVGLGYGGDMAARQLEDHRIIAAAKAGRVDVGPDQPIIPTPFDPSPAGPTPYSTFTPRTVDPTPLPPKGRAELLRSRVEESKRVGRGDLDKRVEYMQAYGYLPMPAYAETPPLRPLANSGVGRGEKRRNRSRGQQPSEATPAVGRPALPADVPMEDNVEIPSSESWEDQVRAENEELGITEMDDFSPPPASTPLDPSNTSTPQKIPIADQAGRGYSMITAPRPVVHPTATKVAVTATREVVKWQYDIGPTTFNEGVLRDIVNKPPLQPLPSRLERNVSFAATPTSTRSGSPPSIRGVARSLADTDLKSLTAPDDSCPSDMPPLESGTEASGMSEFTINTTEGSDADSALPDRSFFYEEVRSNSPQDSSAEYPKEDVAEDPES